jgi:hypothetical protein
MNDIIHNIDMLKAIYRPRKLLPLLEKMIEPMTISYICPHTPVCTDCTDMILPSRVSIEPNTENLKIILKINYKYNNIYNILFDYYQIVNTDYDKIKTYYKISNIVNDIRGYCRRLLSNNLSKFIDMILLDKSYYKYIIDYIIGTPDEYYGFGYCDDDLEIIYKYRRYLNNTDINEHLINVFNDSLIDTYWDGKNGNGYVNESHISVIKRKLFHMKKLKLDMNKLDIPEVINNSRIITETNFNFIYNIGIMWKYDKKVRNRLII